jgi:hypothetical protein
MPHRNRLHEHDSEINPASAQTGGAGQDALEHTEGPVAKAIEHQTAKLPSDTFLWIAGGAALTALALQFTGRKHAGLFLGQWVAPILIAGLYNKLVKTQGHDRAQRLHEHERQLKGGLEPAAAR